MAVAALIVAFTIALVAASGFGIDRQNTVALSSVTTFCALIVAFAVGCIVFQLAHRDSQSETGSERLSHMRKTAPLSWAWRAGSVTILLALLAGLTTRYLLSVAVWYLPGTLENHSATVLSFRPVYGRGKRCDLFGEARLDDGTVKQFCYIGGLIFKHRITDADLHVNESVVLTLSRNALGTAIVSLEPTRR